MKMGEVKGEDQDYQSNKTFKGSYTASSSNFSKARTLYHVSSHPTPSTIKLFLTYVTAYANLKRTF